MKPMTIILIGAIIVILGGLIGAIGTWLHNKESSKDSTRLEESVNKGVSIGETTNSKVLDLQNENKNLLEQSSALNEKIDSQSTTIDLLRKENTELYSKLNSSSLKIYDNLTGGDSYCYVFFIFSTYYPSKDIGGLYIRLGEKNKNPLKDVQIRIFDINSYDPENFKPDDLKKNIFNLETINTDMSYNIQDKIHLDKKEGVNLNIFYSANNGVFSQQLRMRFIEDNWVSATIVKRNDKIIFEDIDEKYPEKDKNIIFK